MERAGRASGFIVRPVTCLMPDLLYRPMVAASLHTYLLGSLSGHEDWVVRQSIAPLHLRVLPKGTPFGVGLPDNF